MSLFFNTRFNNSLYHIKYQANILKKKSNLLILWNNCFIFIFSKKHRSGSKVSLVNPRSGYGNPLCQNSQSWDVNEAHFKEDRNKGNQPYEKIKYQKFGRVWGPCKPGFRGSSGETAKLGLQRVGWAVSKASPPLCLWVLFAWLLVQKHICTNVKCLFDTEVLKSRDIQENMNLLVLVKGFKASWKMGIQDKAQWSREPSDLSHPISVGEVSPTPWWHTVWVVTLLGLQSG